MAHQFTVSYIEDSLSLFRQYKTLAEKAFAQLTDAQLTQQLDQESNSISQIVKHVAGNMRSRWTDFLTTDGEKASRDRDSEFAALNGPGAPELLARLRATVEGAVALFHTLPPARLLERVQVQGYDRTVLAAIYHVVEHFAGHTFQIIYATKLLTGEDLGFYAHLSGAAGRKDPLP